MAQEYVPPQEHIWINTLGPPVGMTPFQPEDLPESAQSCMDQFKYTIRKENERYLAEHREIDALVDIFIAAVLQKKPKDFGEFAAIHFTRPIKEMEKDIRRYLKLLGTPIGSPTSSARIEDQMSLDVEVSLSEELDKTGDIPLVRETSSFLTLSTSLSTKHSSDRDVVLDQADRTVEGFLLELMTELTMTGIMRLYDEKDQTYSDVYTIVQAMLDVAMEISIKSIRGAADDLISNAMLACELITRNASARRKFENKVARGRPEILLAADSPEGFVMKRTVKQDFNRYPKDEYGVYLPLSPTEGSIDALVFSFIAEEIVFPRKPQVALMSDGVSAKN